MEKKSARVLLFFKGMAMGAADSVPGVSGGTIAFITNIYDELLASIIAVNPTTLRLLFSRGPATAWRAVNGAFLLTLVSGILLALVLSANLVVYLLATQYTYLMCFFTGLIVASVWYVSLQIRQWNLLRVGLFLAGMVLCVALAFLPRFSGADSLLYYFFCGALAICAMILPGISGAFILLLLGAYEPVIRALTGMDWPVILVFALGCVTGLLSFARVLFWLLRHQRQGTLACLLGILVGSLYSLWPWRQALAPVANLAEGERILFSYRNLPPSAQDVVTGMAISLPLCLLLAAGGFLLVWGLETLGNKSGVKSNSSV
jgi:putative membrane protein